MPTICIKTVMGRVIIDGDPYGRVESEMTRSCEARMGRVETLASLLKTIFYCHSLTAASQDIKSQQIDFADRIR